ncbi:CaiB/BaiF CoA transferase family protein [Mycolicibacterium aubagnense]|uniref:CoA transferase n=1 Tax=Mycolicibacterium aubagnense TaxID=319707 RepID=A0ABM7IKW2_9MYCO|nr:CaiB/BaiF CoA-transferase family protein [Mycolicibacterium aubagnense]TLH65625.1 carnitine dehydratase [Mycolicibacterium aubagnense]WGI31217.1 CaiB/BaiF CoA-transferase family protein [Mycolicibacterium aubagnense]BBX87385.1 CoA transferase [Mycolicibacterium aubagnense]
MGPLHGVRVIELAGLAPVPFAGMMLADLGADLVRIDSSSRYAPPAGPLDRGKSCIEIDLKDAAGRELVRELVSKADVFMEGFRPGVAERLGVGPLDLCALNSRLIYGRLTGWGQEGPLALRVGHDINYIALTGVLDIIGRHGERPVPPANLIADFAGGGMLLAAGVMGALFERERSGFGQVVDAAMIDGASLLMTFIHGLYDTQMWNAERGSNMLDGAAAYYDTYQTADGKHVALGAVEPEFFATLTAVLDLDDEDLGFQLDPTSWPRWRAVLAEKFRTKTRDEWADIFGDVDACITPVLSPWEAPDHPHHVARGSFIEVDGVRQPAPAPRFGRTPSQTPQALKVLSVAAARARWSGCDPPE